LNSSPPSFSFEHLPIPAVVSTCLIFPLSYTST
jgi:hypothetical protein